MRMDQLTVKAAEAVQAAAVLLPHRPMSLNTNLEPTEAATANSLTLMTYLLTPQETVLYVIGIGVTSRNSPTPVLISRNSVAPVQAMDNSTFLVLYNIRQILPISMSWIEITTEYKN